MKKLLLILLFGFFTLWVQGAYLLIPMDESQKNHLKSYGIAYWVLNREVEVKWLLNYRGGSFLIQHSPEIQAECIIRGVSFESIGDGAASALLAGISSPDVNQDAVSMFKAPKIAVYSPPSKLPGMMP